MILENTTFFKTENLRVFEKEWIENKFSDPGDDVTYTPDIPSHNKNQYLAG